VLRPTVRPPLNPHFLGSGRLLEQGIVTSLSRESVSYWLRTADIKPHRCRYWLNSKDPEYQAKMQRIVEVYVRPPEDGIVLCVDEKTGIQALERKHPDKPTQPGRVRRREFEYKRHGTVSLLASFEVKTGKVVGECIQRNNSCAFIRFLRRLMKIYPKGKLYIILDNGSSHKSKETKRFFDSHSRLVPIFTPTHASWLNQIEIWFGALNRQALRGVSSGSREELRDRTLGYIDYHNRRRARPYGWTYTGQPLSSGKPKRPGKGPRRNRSIPRVFRKAGRWASSSLQTSRC